MTGENMNSEHSLDRIKCPNCGDLFPVTQALNHQIAERAREEVTQRVARREKELETEQARLKEEQSTIDRTVAEKTKLAVADIEKQAHTKAQEAVSIELEDLKRQAAEKDRKLDTARQAELELRKQKRELDERAKNLDLEAARKIDEERQKIQDETAHRVAEAHKAVTIELEDLKRQTAEKDRKLDAARQTELEWRKEKRELDERAKNLDLETARKIDEERQKIQDETARRVAEEYRMRDAEKDKKLQDALKVNDELKRKLEQGSQQTQGEVLELQLEELIRAAFPLDQIEAVPKGINGADVVQKVFNKSGHFCGTIVWESKRTKVWSEGWLQKLKDDQRALKAEIAILVSEVLPKDITGFSQRSGIWISNFSSAIGVAQILRAQLIQLANVRAAAVGKNEKMEVIYGYLTSTEFRQRVEAIAEAFIQMQSDLSEERRVAEKRWAKRQKEIDRVFQNTAGMYGELQGLLGSTSLQDIPALTASEGQFRDDHVTPTKLPKAIVQLRTIEPEDAF
jgi:hypothetical protein